MNTFKPRLSATFSSDMGLGTNEMDALTKLSEDLDAVIQAHAEHGDSLECDKAEHQFLTTTKLILLKHPNLQDRLYGPDENDTAQYRFVQHMFYSLQKIYVTWVADKERATQALVKERKPVGTPETKSGRWLSFSVGRLVHAPQVA